MWQDVLTPYLYLHPKEDSIQFSYVGRCLNVYFVVNGGRVFNSIDYIDIKHRCNFACVLLFSREKLEDLFP